VHDAASPALAAWSNYYVIAGSSAAALTGLMFVVITLTAGRRSRVTGEGVATFNTPTVVNFCAALLISAIVTAPWHSLFPAGVLVGLVGLAGVAYSLRVTYRLRTRMSELYSPEVDDWLWYAVLPTAAYLLVAGAAIGLFAAATGAPFALAAAAILLIFIGIHNAWDVVTYLAMRIVSDPDDGAAAQPTAETKSPSAHEPPSEG
jgi:hypothetical protein